MESHDYSHPYCTYHHSLYVYQITVGYHNLTHKLIAISMPLTEQPFQKSQFQHYLKLLILCCMLMPIECHSTINNTCSIDEEFDTLKKDFHELKKNIQALLPFIMVIFTIFETYVFFYICKYQNLKHTLKLRDQSITELTRKISEKDQILRKHSRNIFKLELLLKLRQRLIEHHLNNDRMPQ